MGIRRNHPIGNDVGAVFQGIAQGQKDIVARHPNLARRADFGSRGVQHLEEDRANVFIKVQHDLAGGIVEHLFSARA